MTAQTLALVVGAFALGVVVGAVLALFISERAQERLARYQRTGRPGAPPSTTISTVPGGEFHEFGMSEEAKAQQRAQRNVVERGAEQFMAIHPELTLDEARARAKAALEAVGAFKA
jgi:hypothetical protein